MPLFNSMCTSLVRLKTKLTPYLILKFNKDHILIGCGISDDLDTLNKFSEKKLEC